MDSKSASNSVKPYCVVCPQSVMAMVWAVVAVGIVVAGIYGEVHWVVASVVLAQICVGCGVKRFRRVTFSRELMTVAFALLAAYSIYRVCISAEPWDTTPKCEEDVPAWNGGGRRDPGGEKVAYLMMAVMFVSLAGMPWLPPGNRYYRGVRNGGNPKPLDVNKAKGMLWGLIVGDALGSPIQFSGKDSHPWITEMEPCSTFCVPAGYWTDDGSMAMCVMDSFVRKGRYDLKDIGDTFVKWMDEGYLSSTDYAFDVGVSTCDGVKAIKHGSLKNGREEAQGNGSIMRFAPSYWIARRLGRPEVMHEVSDLTHASQAVRKLCDELAAVLDGHFAGRRTTKGSGKELPRSMVPNSGWCVDSLNAALWAFNTTTSFEDALIAAVNLGGDADSIGAVCGQIAGAYYGFDAIPSRWVEAVKDWREVDSLINRFLSV